MRYANWKRRYQWCSQFLDMNDSVYKNVKSAIARERKGSRERDNDREKDKEREGETKREIDTGKEDQEGCD